MERIKILGIIGVVFYLLSYIPDVTYFFLIIGTSILLFTFWDISKYYKEDGIFSKFLIGMVLQAVANFLFFAKIVAVLFALIIGVMSQNPIIPAFGSIAIYFGVYYILNVVGAYFIKESLVLLNQKSGVSVFSYSGVLIILGAVLKVIAVGYIVELIGWALLAFGFLILTPVQTQKTKSDDDVIDVEAEEVKLIEEKN